MDNILIICGIVQTVLIAGVGYSSYKIGLREGSKACLDFLQSRSINNRLVITFNDEEITFE